MKILVIGLDAATMELVKPWAAAGHLPAIARLTAKGVSAPFLSTPNMHSASAWTSILTGLNPGRHGLFVFSDRDFATNRQLFFKGGDREGLLISSHLALHGMTAGFLNVPMTYPAENNGSGFMVSGLDAPALNEKAFCPASLRRELFDRFADYSFAPAGLGELMKAGRVDEAIQAWLKLIDTQSEAACYLMESHPVDFFMTVFTASDWAGHNLWKPDRTADLLSVYQKLDRAVASLLTQADEGTQVYIISDHGMGPHTGASYRIAAWLESKGYMARGKKRRAKASLVSASRRAAKKIVPSSVKERIKSRVSDERIKRLQSDDKDSFYASIDWENTVAYSEPGRHVININLAGRNLYGKVAVAEYRNVCDRIIKDLETWTDAQGRQVVERVVHREDVYKGPFVERASDLYIHWNKQADLGPPPKEVQSRGFWWSGDHRPEGIMICKGPGIKSGVSLETASVYDFVPTVMYLAGLPVPEDLDGRVIEGACTTEYLASHPRRVEPGRARQEKSQTDLSESEEQLVEEKLRSLGYL
ncbi:MAG TPA: alkaline phosphatase family protein [Blastocatellia bacterium]|nr:alkaline phosphatase family protein [Blastocatellia bacterium]